MKSADGRGRSTWLYVPPDELSEAMALGARHVEGDARLLVPDPIPPGFTIADYERWRTPDAVRHWVRLTSLAVLEAETGSRAHPPGAGADRVYLNVPLSERDKAAATPGVRFDARLDRHYVADPAHLANVFGWLTPDAERREREERAMRALEERALITRSRSFASDDPQPAKTVASL